LTSIAIVKDVAQGFHICVQMNQASNGHPLTASL
jgi:hypothetical protein